MKVLIGLFSLSKGGKPQNIDLALVELGFNKLTKSFVVLSAVEPLTALGQKTYIPVAQNSKLRMQSSLIQSCDRDYSQPNSFHMCTGKIMADLNACQYVEGSPVLLHDRLLGISFFDDCKLRQRIFIAIGPILSWIRSTIVRIEQNQTLESLESSIAEHIKQNLNAMRHKWPSKRQSELNFHKNPLSYKMPEMILTHKELGSNITSLKLKPNVKRDSLIDGESPMMPPAQEDRKSSITLQIKKIVTRNPLGDKAPLTMPPVLNDREYSKALQIKLNVRRNSQKNERPPTMPQAPEERRFSTAFQIKQNLRRNSQRDEGLSMMSQIHKDLKLSSTAQIKLNDPLRDRGSPTVPQALEGRESSLALQIKTNTESNPITEGKPPMSQQSLEHFKLTTVEQVKPNFRQNPKRSTNLKTPRGLKVFVPRTDIGLQENVQNNKKSSYKWAVTPQAIEDLLLSDNSTMCTRKARGKKIKYYVRKLEPKGTKLLIRMASEIKLKNTTQLIDEKSGALVVTVKNIPAKPMNIKSSTYSQETKTTLERSSSSVPSVILMTKASIPKSTTEPVSTTTNAMDWFKSAKEKMKQQHVYLVLTTTKRPIKEFVDLTM